MRSNKVRTRLSDQEKIVTILKEFHNQITSHPEYTAIANARECRNYARKITEIVYSDIDFKVSSKLEYRNKGLGRRIVKVVSELLADDNRSIRDVEKKIRNPICAAVREHYQK